MGTNTKWTDLVFYINNVNRKQPWLLIEIKTASNSLTEARTQAESYSLILDVSFFGVTDGINYHFYITGKSQGKSIRLKDWDFPPRPDYKYLDSKVHIDIFSEKVNELIPIFLEALKTNPAFLQNTTDHDKETKELAKQIFNRIDKVSKDEVKIAFERHLMTKRPNLNKIFKQIDDDFQNVKKPLSLLKLLKETRFPLLISY